MRFRDKAGGLVALLATASLLVAAAPAGAAVTIGSNLAVDAVDNLPCFPEDGGCTVANVQHNVNPVVSPIDGVIVRWRTRYGEDLFNNRLRVLQISGNAITALRSSPPVNLAMGLQTIPLSPGLPIAAGDLVGVDVYGLARVAAPRPGATLLRTIPVVADGGIGTGTPGVGQEIMFNADVEPDCDGDLLGDETQDADLAPCPPAPETTITGGPKDKTRKKQATFVFTTDDPAATFECSLDGGAFASCSSPHTVKVKKGKHSFQVRASDAGNNADGSPATDDWKVKKKKRR